MIAPFFVPPGRARATGARLDPKTGEVIECLMPTEFDTKKIAFDPTGDHVSLLMTNMRTARLLRVEVLD